MSRTQPNIASIIHELRVSGDPTEEKWADAIASLNARTAELEANEKAYEEIIGKMTYQEVADRIQELEGALRQSIVAIDDWLHIYAGEFCDSACVEESARRIGEYGTIGYIAEVQAKNRSALEAKHD